MASASTNPAGPQRAAYTSPSAPQTTPRNNVEYELTVRQQPKQARMCGVGGKADRRPIDPPPIVQLRVVTPSNPTPRPPSASSSGIHSYLQNPYYFMFASLASPDTDEELHLLKDGKTRCTTGSVVSSLYNLKDSENGGQDAGFFVFPDLSVRTEGSYRLKLTLFEVIGGNVHHCKSIFSKPFYVYTAKKFPGMEESTGLSCSLADQGIKIRIRKDIRVRKRPSRGDDDEDDEDDDDDAYDDDDRRMPGKRGRGDGVRGKSGRKNKRPRVANSATNEESAAHNEWGVIDPALTAGGQPPTGDPSPPDTRTHQPPPPPAPYAHYAPHVYAPPPPMPYPPPPASGQPPYPADPRAPPPPHEGYRDVYGHYHPPPPPPPQGYGSPTAPPSWDHYRPATMPPPPQPQQYDFAGAPPPPPRGYVQPPPAGTPGYPYGHYDTQYQQGAPAPGPPNVPAAPRKEGQPPPAPTSTSATAPAPVPAPSGAPPTNSNPNAPAPPPPISAAQQQQQAQYVGTWNSSDAAPQPTAAQATQGQRGPYPPPPPHPGYAPPPVHHQQYQHQYAYPHAPPPHAPPHPSSHPPPPPPQQDWYGYPRPAQGWAPQPPQPPQGQPPPPGQSQPPPSQPYYENRGYHPPQPQTQAPPYRDERAQAPAPAPTASGAPQGSGGDRIELAPLRGSPPRPPRESQGQYTLQGARFEGRYRSTAGGEDERGTGGTGTNGKKNPLSIGSIISDRRDE